MDDGADYTTLRLAHANHDHLNATSTTLFIGPIPHGWFTTHKRKWLRPHTNYHRQGQSFSTEQLNTEGSRNLAACARWQAEGDVLLATTEAADHTNTLDEEFGSELIEPTTSTSHSHAACLEEDSHKSNASSGEIEPLESGLDDDTSPLPVPGTSSLLAPTTAQDHASPSARPSMSITSPIDGQPLREASTVSTASFITAPETQEEQARLFDELDGNESEASSHGSADDDASDASTVRQAPRSGTGNVHGGPTTPLNHQRTPNLDQDAAGSTQEASQMTPSSSDANSRRSLMHNRRHADFEPREQNIGAAQMEPRLVHFAEATEHERSSAQEQTAPVACPEGLELDRKTTALLHRRNRGYFGQRLLRNPFRTVKQPGELLRAERILLRVESARKSDVPSDYSDAKAHRLERRTDMHWKEFVLAARENEEGLLVLSFHRDRSIPMVAKNTTKIRATETIILNPQTTRVNLYSALDKTIVIWQKAKRTRKGTMIYILRPSTTHASIQWYALIQTKLNIKPKAIAIVTVPNLNMKIQIDLSSERGDGNETEGSSENEEALSITSDEISSRSSASTARSLLVNEHGQIESGGVAITGDYIMSTCWNVLSKSREWKDVLDDWKHNEKLGLCWRRYDRLEWIHGNNAKALVGQWAMQASHELELRPKVHYATKVKLPDGESMNEPHPVEGFLIRLTSSTGRQARFGKVFYKRLYFSSHDGLLFFSTPAKATPPPPPDFLTTGKDDIETLLKETPMIYDVEPYPLVDGRIEWLRSGVDKELRIARNRVAMTENARRVAQLQASDGYIDLAKVVKIRPFQTSSDDRENDIEHDGDDVHFHESGEQDNGLLQSDMDGTTSSIDDDRVFELVLATGLVVRLQAFNSRTRTAWMRQLTELVKYWKWRYKADATEFQKLRKTNIEVLQVDEEVEALVGAYANKWEVSQCFSEPQIYNFCPIVSCRTIALRGLLYRKPRINATFRKHECVVSHGQLLVFSHKEYDASGTISHRIHQSKAEVIDLRDCYVYSGVATQNELINARDTNDRDGPGHHSLPRLYADGWTSQDEQEALSFVIWSGKRRLAWSGVDKSDSDKRNGSVSRLGVSGKSMVYMARCRQERDLWVQILGNEIQRMANLG